jgi:hypothetical protein
MRGTLIRSSSTTVDISSDPPVTYQLDHLQDWSLCKPGHRQVRRRLGCVCGVLVLVCVVCVCVCVCVCVLICEVYVYEIYCDVPQCAPWSSSYLITLHYIIISFHMTSYNISNIILHHNISHCITSHVSQPSP